MCAPPSLHRSFFVVCFGLHLLCDTKQWNNGHQWLFYWLDRRRRHTFAAAAVTKLYYNWWRLSYFSSFFPRERLYYCYINFAHCQYIRRFFFSLFVSRSLCSPAPQTHTYTQYRYKWFRGSHWKFSEKRIMLQFNLFCWRMADDTNIIFVRI